MLELKLIHVSKRGPSECVMHPFRSCAFRVLSKMDQVSREIIEFAPEESLAHESWMMHVYLSELDDLSDGFFITWTNTSICVSPGTNLS